MALQGDLQSFALPDVLRLLAGTSKTGHLGVTGIDRSGDVWLRDGQIVGGSVTSSPHATDPADVVFELLRFEDGAFAFDDDARPDAASPPTSVDDVIGRAEDLVRDWNDVESVVPSVQSWVSFVAEIEGDSTTITAEHWRTLAVIGGGLTVRELGDHFEQTDLAVSRRVKALVEAGLVELGDAPGDVTGQAVVTPQPTEEDHDDLSLLRADDGPVVLETSEDALLPEPLPSAGTSFEGDLTDMTSVDGRRFDAEDQDLEEIGFGAEASGATSDDLGSSAPYAALDPVPGGADGSTSYDVEDLATNPFEAFGAAPPADLGQAADDPGLAVDPFGSDDFGSDDFFSVPAGGSTEEVSDDPLASTPSSDVGGGAAAAAAEGEDPERGALLDFLSTVKP